MSNLNRVVARSNYAGTTTTEGARGRKTACEYCHGIRKKCVQVPDSLACERCMKDGVPEECTPHIRKRNARAGRRGAEALKANVDFPASLMDITISPSLAMELTARVPEALGPMSSSEATSMMASLARAQPQQGGSTMWLQDAVVEQPAYDLVPQQDYTMTVALPPVTTSTFSTNRMPSFSAPTNLVDQGLLHSLQGTTTTLHGVPPMSMSQQVQLTCDPGSSRVPSCGGIPPDVQLFVEYCVRNALANAVPPGWTSPYTLQLQEYPDAHRCQFANELLAVQAGPLMRQ